MPRRVRPSCRVRCHRISWRRYLSRGSPQALKTTERSKRAMKWITRERVNVDRVACPWLIKKFVDPQAEFLFVPAERVLSESDRLGATPLDVKGVELGHQGKECTF